MKIKDITAIVGEYQKDGATKKIYRNVGELHQKDDGSQFILLDKIFNPAALAIAGKDKIVLNLYEPKQKENSTSGQNKPVDDMNDDIPF